MRVWYANERVHEGEKAFKWRHITHGCMGVHGGAWSFKRILLLTPGSLDISPPPMPPPPMPPPPPPPISASGLERHYSVSLLTARGNLHGLGFTARCNHAPRIFSYFLTLEEVHSLIQGQQQLPHSYSFCLVCPLIDFLLDLVNLRPDLNKLA